MKFSIVDSHQYKPKKDFGRYLRTLYSTYKQTKSPIEFKHQDLAKYWMPSGQARLSKDPQTGKAMRNSKGEYIKTPIEFESFLGRANFKDATGFECCHFVSEKLLHEKFYPPHWRYFAHEREILSVAPSEYVLPENLRQASFDIYPNDRGFDDLLKVGPVNGQEFYIPACSLFWENEVCKASDLAGASFIQVPGHQSFFQPDICIVFCENLSQRLVGDL